MSDSSPRILELGNSTRGFADNREPFTGDGDLAQADIVVMHFAELGNLFAQLVGQDKEAAWPRVQAGMKRLEDYLEGGGTLIAVPVATSSAYYGAQPYVKELIGWAQKIIGAEPKHKTGQQVIPGDDPAYRGFFESIGASLYHTMFLENPSGPVGLMVPEGHECVATHRWVGDGGLVLALPEVKNPEKRREYVNAAVALAEGLRAESGTPARAAAPAQVDDGDDDEAPAANLSAPSERAGAAIGPLERLLSSVRAASRASQQPDNDDEAAGDDDEDETVEAASDGYEDDDDDEALGSAPSVDDDGEVDEDEDDDEEPLELTAADEVEETPAAGTAAAAPDDEPAATAEDDLDEDEDEEEAAPPPTPASSAPPVEPPAPPASAATPSAATPPANDDRGGTVAPFRRATPVTPPPTPSAPTTPPASAPEPRQATTAARTTPPATPSTPATSSTSESTPASGGDWSEHFLLPADAEIAQSIMAIEEQIADLQAEQKRLRAQLVSGKHRKALVAAQGEGFTAAVREAFQDLGYKLERAGNGDNAFVLTHASRPDTPIVTYCTGTSGAIQGREVVARLMHLEASYFGSHGELPKMLAVLNPEAGTPLDARDLSPAAQFGDTLVDLAGKRGWCVISGLQLLGMTLDGEQSAETREALAGKLADGNGTLDAYDDWGDFLVKT